MNKVIETRKRLALPTGMEIVQNSWTVYAGKGKWGRSQTYRALYIAMELKSDPLFRLQHLFYQLLDALAVDGSQLRPSMAPSYLLHSDPRYAALASISDLKSST